MQRREAWAAVAAVTMSLVSGVVALGANTGTLGFASNPAPVTTPATTGTATNAATTQNTSGTTSGASGGEHEHSSTATDRAPKGGERDD